jgi:hypothetical protein
MQMMRLRKVRSVTFTLVGLCILGSPIRLTAQCWGEASAAVARTNGGYVTGDGIRHVTYSIPSGWGSEIRAAIEAAVNDWNSKTSTTKVQFEPFQPGFPNANSAASFQFEMGGTGMNCGGYVAGDGQRLRLHSNLISAAGQYSGQVAQVIGHELGHTMNLGESTDVGSIMTVPGYVDCNSNAISSFPGTSPSQNDANNAAGCINQIVQQGAQYNGGEQSTTEWPLCECWEYVRYIYAYVANGQGGYSLYVLDRIVLDSGCGTPPY